MPAAKSPSRSKAAPRSKPTSQSGSVDATKLLAADHKEVKGLFADYEKLAKAEADGGDRQTLAQRICALLTVHATIEEEIFYPAAREALDEQEVLDEAEVEHESVKDLVSQIESISPDDELYDAKLKVLGEYVNHHATEEEGEMFPKCRKSDMDLAELGSELEERKGELMQELGLEAPA